MTRKKIYKTLVLQNNPSLINCVTSKNREIILATQAMKVRQVDPNDDEPIKQVLRYIFTLIGLKADNIPDDVQKAVLINYIRQDLSNYGLEEFKIAFHRLINGELGMDATHYQNFSSLYLGQVMRAYHDNIRTLALRELRQARDEQEKKEAKKTPEQIKKDQIEFIEETILFAWRYYNRTGSITFGICPYKIIYKSLVEDMKMFEAPSELKKNIYSQAFDIVKDQMERKNQNWETINDARSFRKIHEQIQEHGLEKICKNDIVSKCYELTIHHYFKKFKEDQVDVEQIIKDYILTL